MLSFLCKNKIQMTPKLRDYCIKSTNDSIKKITEKHNEEKKIQKFTILPSSNPSDPSSNIAIFLSVLFFLSSSRYIYNFYKDSIKNLFSFNKYIDA
jgi:hypothetical protein